MNVIHTCTLASAPWLPPQASSIADNVDYLFNFITGISVFFFVLIIALMVFFVLRYRRKYPGQEPAGRATHNTALELAWTVLPLIIVLYIFWVGLQQWSKMFSAPDNAYPILVSAKQWSWTFRYPNGYVSGKLHVPGGVPVKLTLKSRDVIHSFYVPAFRVKRDVVPGRYNKLWFKAKPPPPGKEYVEYRLVCAEYCGTDHSGMITTVRVHQPGWEPPKPKVLGPKATTKELIAAGRDIYNLYCASCHTTTGEPAIGPTWKGLFGSTEKVEVEGEIIEVEVDSQYIRTSILDPQRAIVVGYPPTMPPLGGLFSEQELDALIAFIKSLSNKQ